jgi:ParB family chromosome partitioning protein
VKRTSVDYLELLDSVENYGILNSITVRPHPTKKGKYEVVDGLHRYSVAVDLELETVPCIVKDFTDVAVLAAQIATQSIRPVTKPIEFARHLRALQSLIPDCRLADLSQLVNKRPSWVKNQLGLLNLDEKYQLMVERGEMPLRTAYMLARLPVKLQHQFAKLSDSIPPVEFKQAVEREIKRMLVDSQTRRLSNLFLDEFEPVPHMRKLKEILDEVDTLKICEATTGPLQLLTPKHGWIAALKWVLHLDPDAVAQQRKKARMRGLDTTNFDNEDANDLERKRNSQS